MGAQTAMSYASTGANSTGSPDLLRLAARIDIQSAERAKLEAMCRHIGCAPEGKSDAVLRRMLTVLSCTHAD